jgi:hypothetical protein
MFFFFTLVNVRTFYHGDIYIYILIIYTCILIYIYLDLMMIHMFHPSLFFLLCGLKHWTSKCIKGNVHLFILAVQNGPLLCVYIDIHTFTLILFV